MGTAPEGRSRGTWHLGHEAGGGTLTDHFIEGTHAARSTLGGGPFPPIADYGFLSDLRGVGARRAERKRRMDVPAPNGRAERVCSDARPGSRLAVIHLIREDERGGAAIVAPSGLDSSAAAVPVDSDEPSTAPS
jgi:hypothetical protein